jgi:hypothetical protein
MIMMMMMMMHDVEETPREDRPQRGPPKADLSLEIPRREDLCVPSRAW